jgi:hypothetical protein
MYLKETFRNVHIGRYMLYAFPIQSGVKQRDALLPLLFNFVLEYVLQEGLELNGTHQHHQEKHRSSVRG